MITLNKMSNATAALLRLVISEQLAEQTLVLSLEDKNDLQNLHKEITEKLQGNMKG